MIPRAFVHAAACNGEATGVRVPKRFFQRSAGRSIRNHDSAAHAKASGVAHATLCSGVPGAMYCTSCAAGQP